METLVAVAAGSTGSRFRASAPPAGCVSITSVLKVDAISSDNHVRQMSWEWLANWLESVLSCTKHCVPALAPQPGDSLAARWIREGVLGLFKARA